jgi:hypothetical protein
VQFSGNGLGRLLIVCMMSFEFTWPMWQNGQPTNPPAGQVRRKQDDTPNRREGYDVRDTLRAAGMTFDGLMRTWSIKVDTIAAAKDVAASIGMTVHRA